MKRHEQERLDSITGGDRATKRELLTLFLVTAERCLRKMDAGAAADWHAAAHELKGAADNLGFRDIGELCARAEHPALSPAGKRTICTAIRERALSVRRMMERI